MKESDLLVTLAQVFWDTDQVLFARGLVPCDWLSASELAECSEVRMWESRRFVKSTSSTTENGYENCTYSTNNIHMSDEDNNHDTNYINKHNDVNTDTRKLHL